MSSIGRHNENASVESSSSNPGIRQHLPNLPAYRKGSHHPHYASVPYTRASGVLPSAPQIWRYHYSTQPSQPIFLEILHKTPSVMVHSHAYNAPYTPSIPTSRSVPVHQIHPIVFLAAATIALPPARGAVQSTRSGVLRHDRSQPSHDLESASAC